MNFLDNITFRRNRTKLNTSNSSDDDCESVHSSNENTSNLPDISDDNLNEVQKLKERILALETELAIARKQIDALSLENKNLKRCNEDIVCENRSDNNTKKYESAKSTDKNSKCNSEQEQRQNINDKLPNATLGTTQRQKQQKKICILSTNTTNKILKIAKDRLKNYSNLCHYIKPHTKLINLITDIKAKLTDFTLNDFCVILVGDEDFKTTNDYFTTISQVRHLLQEINNTNIIICLPTYRYGNHANMFNWRVESFNNLLYLDITTHEHAYILDSNNKLEYNYRMFRRSGSINDYGMKVIFEALQNEIENIHEYNATLQWLNEPEVSSDPSAQFFRE